MRDIPGPFQFCSSQSICLRVDTYDAYTLNWIRSTMLCSALDEDRVLDITNILLIRIRKAEDGRATSGGVTDTRPAPTIPTTPRAYTGIWEYRRGGISRLELPAIRIWSVSDNLERITRPSNILHRPLSNIATQTSMIQRQGTPLRNTQYTPK